MRHIVKKILKETYEHKVLDTICQTLSTGNNQKSPEFMKKLKTFINNSDELTDNIKEECNNVFNKWESDMHDGVQNGRTHNSGTGDSESDESNTYFRQIQSIICGKYILAMD